MHWRGSDRPLVLCGLPGVGKTTIGPEVARLLGWRFVDLDVDIVATSGKSITEWFADGGEPAFRAYEQERLRANLVPNTVLAVGGGAVASDGAVAIVRRNARLVWLRASTAELVSRLSDLSSRPLLQAEPDLTSKVQTLLAARHRFYAAAELYLDTTNDEPSASARRLVAHGAVEVATIRFADERAYGIHFDSAAGAEERFVDELARVSAEARRLAIVTDDHVGPLHAERYAAALRRAGYAVTVITIPHGEASKSFAVAERVLDELVQGRLGRQSAVLALGGGVVGDLAGFCAAVFMRGIDLVQIPTTVLAQVDSAVGGKTGVNLPSGKNLAGAFWQPRLVYVDGTTLATLPPRDRIAGLAELVKHALLDGEAELRRVEEAAATLADGPPAALLPLIAQSCRIKARVVAADEHERSDAPDGGRAQLNFGHTLGHALEAESLATAEPLRHGEAVALGMMAALHLGVVLGTTPATLENRVRDLLQKVRLPTDVRRRLTSKTTSFLLADKKNRQNGSVPTIRWVLLEQPGAPRVFDVGVGRIEAALASTL